MSLHMIVHKDSQQRVSISFHSYYDRDVVVAGHTTFTFPVSIAKRLQDALQKAIQADFHTAGTEIEII